MLDRLGISERYGMMFSWFDRCVEMEKKVAKEKRALCNKKLRKSGLKKWKQKEVEKNGISTPL